ncbi:MAG: VIT domain-containing protein [Gemmatimonadota bacterium]
MHHWLLSLSLVAVVTTNAAAQGWIEPERMPPLRMPSAVVRVGSEIRATVEGRVARFEVEERFQNRGGGLAEGSYLYPLPADAAFSDFSLFQGDRELKGEVMHAEQARQIYEEIVRRRRDPALLTLAGHGLIRAQVFPIQPGETRTVILRYTQLLPRESDAFHLRYSLGARGEGSETHLRVRVKDARGYGTPYSPTHPLQTRVEDGELRIAVNGLATGDVQLYLPIRSGLVTGSLLAHAPSGEDGFYLMLLSPPPVFEGAVMPRELTMVVDVSGSMSGAKLEQAKAALTQALNGLRSTDRFRLIAFSSTVRSFHEGFVDATADQVRDARRYVDGLVASGGTNIQGALDAALGTSPGDGLPLLLFLTDGLPSVGEQSPDRLASVAAGRVGRTRIFPIGIGHDVNTYLLDRLAVEGHGTTEYIAPGADVEAAVSGVMGKLSQPALVNLRVVTAPVELTQSTPNQLPDLFFGEELVVLGRYHGTGNGNVVIEGERNGRKERFVIHADFPRSTASNEFLAPLWASRRIGELTRQIRLDGPAPSLVAEVRELGLRYGIITEYTSYLVKEPEMVANQSVPSPSAAPMPRRMRAEEQTGAEAFERAKSSAAMGRARTLDDVAGSADSRLRELARDAGGAAELKRVGERVFARRGNVWTDVAHRTSLQVMTIAAMSPAYFELARGLPELTPALALGGEIIVAGKAVSIRIAPEGIAAWQGDALADLVRRFRGR